MQMWKFLVLPAIDDEPEGRQMVLNHNTLRGSNEVHKERIGRLKIRKGVDSFFGDDDDVEWVIRLGVKKSQQGVRLP